MEFFAVTNGSDKNRHADEEEKIKNYGWRSLLAQVIATSVPALLLIGLGMQLTFPTIVIGDLYNNPLAQFTISESQSSWYGSILYLCQPVGSFLSGYLQDRCGRRSCMIIACMPAIIGWILLQKATSIPLLYAATFVMGMGVGFNDGPSYSYIGEITEPKFRGVMSSVINLACVIGTMSVYLLSVYYHWTDMAKIATLCPVLSLLMVAFIPESPAWLMSKGKYDTALDSVCWFRGWVKPHVVNDEYREMLCYYSSSNRDKAGKKENGLALRLRWIKNPLVYRPMVLVTIYYFSTLICCLMPSRPYLVDMIREMGLNADHGLFLVLFGWVQVAGSLLILYAVPKYGKRLLTLVTIGLNTVVVFAYGASTMAVKYGWMEPVGYIPIIAYCVVLFSGSLGPMSLPWTLLGEVYPNEAKGFAAGMSTAIFYLMTFGTTKLYLTVEMAMGLSNVLFTSAVFASFGFVYLYKYLPETENRTFSEIEQFFMNKPTQTEAELV
ncbi:facilitated trehalose transporter Tret1-like isoform X2 [Adelges cooleyi]|uniref:facilitated trehalose transporter Tret1-like isoform X2 n=1 Tax=Adelges cooleyi TaxID=133065 RepID=UPI00217F3032|nr:facilitated trehalose transporter Tret1-like isoform X2 [Adelges cooleyi]